MGHLMACYDDENDKSTDYEKPKDLDEDL